MCFADDLVRWFQLLCLTGPLAVAEPKTLRWGLWHAPARLMHRDRRRIMRTLDGWPTTTALLDTYQRIARITRAPPPPRLSNHHARRARRDTAPKHL